MRILVADDSKTNLALITNSLNKLGHEVIGVTSGQEAIDMFQLNRPDLIILDVIMEGMDGFECAKKIRALNLEDWIPIIFLSGAVDDENIAKGINAGGDDYLTKPYSEITLAAKINAMQRIATIRQKLYEMTVKLSILSTTDAVTGIYNRLQFDKSIKEKIAHAKRHHKSFTLLFVDLDHFKLINDSLGHHVGDLLLKEVAARLTSSLRLEDFIARIGGDEFAVILSETHDKNDIKLICEKIIIALSAPYNIVNNNINISASIGIASYPDAISEEQLIQNADMAMYHAKDLGRNNYQYFTKALNEKYQQKLYLKTGLKSSLDNQEIILMYQPIVSLKTKKIVKVEAIPCWKHPELGLILPSIFIPLANEMNLDEVIGNWIIQKVCEQAAKWHLLNYKNLRIATQILSRQLLQKKITETIQTTLQEYKLPSSILELELSDTSLITYSTFCENIIRELHSAGINIVLDNFGTGYSSLMNFKNLPINGIKMDPSFIRDIDNPHEASLAKAIIMLGHVLGFDVIATGVETIQQLNFLEKNDCHFVQGDYLYPLKTADEMTTLFEMHKKELSCK